jgi:hypothetical protein
MSGYSSPCTCNHVSGLGLRNLNGDRGHRPLRAHDLDGKGGWCFYGFGQVRVRPEDCASERAEYQHTVQRAGLARKHLHALSIGKIPSPVRATERSPKKIDGEGRFGAKLNTAQLRIFASRCNRHSLPGQQGCWIDRNRSDFRALRLTEQIEDIR